MAHATPAPGAPRTPGTPGSGVPGSRRPRTPDVFGERTHVAAHWTLPVVLGLVYGYWAAADNRDGGAITGWNVLFGFVTAFAFMALYVGVRAIAPHMRREQHALTWAAFAGIAFGFLYSQGDATVLRSTFMSLPIAAAVFAVAFYRYYTHEDAEGHRVE